MAFEMLKTDFFEKADAFRQQVISRTMACLGATREDVEDAIQNWYEYLLKYDEWAVIAIADIYPIMCDNVYKLTIDVARKKTRRSEQETSNGHHVHIRDDETVRSPELNFEAKQRFERLESRQQVVAQYVVDGKSVEWIALELKISQRAVERLIERAAAKIRLDERSHPYDGRWNAWPKPRIGYDEEGYRRI